MLWWPEVCITIRSAEQFCLQCVTCALTTVMLSPSGSMFRLSWWRQGTHGRQCYPYSPHHIITLHDIYMTPPIVLLFLAVFSKHSFSQSTSVSNALQTLAMNDVLYKSTFYITLPSVNLDHHRAARTLILWNPRMDWAQMAKHSYILHHKANPLIISDLFPKLVNATNDTFFRTLILIMDYNLYSCTCQILFFLYTKAHLMKMKSTKVSARSSKYMPPSL